MIHSAKAHWSGTLTEGKGELTTDSEILKNVNYSFKTRFEEGTSGTNPEELLAAAHAGCFAMSVVAVLTQKEKQIDSIDVKASVTMEGLKIISVLLVISGVVPELNELEFKTFVKEAEENCLISQVLNIPVVTEVHLTEQPLLN